MRDAMRDAETENASNASNVSPSPAPSMARVRETTSGKDRRDVDALFCVPPGVAPLDSMRERARARARFVTSAGERAFLAEKGFAPPTRCKACRDARKPARERATPPAAGAGTPRRRRLRTQSGRGPENARENVRAPAACRLGRSATAAAADAQNAESEREVARGRRGGAAEEEAPRSPCRAEKRTSPRRAAP